jgi:phage/conjugal plasmid C-4 type zinc finger TraR family protein
MDQFDRASELEQVARDKAIAYHQAKMQHGESATDCADCGEPIPEPRRLAVIGVKRCVDCQGILEERGLR